jgi:MFS family permease
VSRSESNDGSETSASVDARPEAVTSAVSSPLLAAGEAAATEVTGTAVRMTASDDRPPVSARYIWLIVLALFGVYLAYVTPLGVSLAIRVQELAPDHEEYLGYITGAGATVAVLTAPIFGVISDRTRTRWGRRRPYMAIGGASGLLALLLMALAPSIAGLGLGWVLAMVTWGMANAALLATQADRLPAAQRGKVAGLAGFVTMVAPVVGSGIASGLTGNNVLLFLVPGGLGFVFLAFFFVFVGGDDSRKLTFAEGLRPATVLRNYVYSPRQHPDFSWNWLGRFLFMAGVTFNTTFGTFFYADRLGKPVSEAAGIIAVVSLGTVAATGLGAIGGGFLSDKLRRRRVFILGAGVAFAIGSILMAVAPNIALVFTGASVTSLGLGAFSAVDQALVLDVLPESDTDAGRFLGINNFSTQVPQAVAPLIAPLFLAIGTTGSDKNYPLLFVIAAACTLAGGLIVLLRVRNIR